MAQSTAPNSPRLSGPFVDRDGRLSRDGLAIMESMWRQVAAGYVVVPCEASGTNAITLTPIMHDEGGATYADHMVFAAVAAATSTGAVTAAVGDLDALKVYKEAGATQAGSGDVVAASLYFFAYNAALDAAAGGLVLISTATIKSSSATTGIGYATGAGGTITQATNKSTGVTLSKVVGQITMNAASLAAATTVSFTLTNTAIAVGDILILNHVSGGTAGAYTLNAQAAAGSASINVRNITAGALAEAIVIGFAVIKGVTA